MAVKLHQVYGHDALKDRLERAIASGRFPQVALFNGPQGIGKQRVALWAAQALLCTSSAQRPCGTCQSCGLVDTLSHPDAYWFVPLVPKRRPGDAQKQIQEAEEALSELMVERRKQPLYEPPDPRASHSLAAIRLLLRRVSMKPFQGSRKVLILGDAERLVVQEASQEAANALLKVLEEPPADTTIILTAASSHALLPTIRSRLVPIRIGPVGDEAVRAFGEAVLGLSGRALDRVTASAGGRIGTTIASNGDGDAADRAAERFLSAVAKGPVAWTEQALQQVPWAARGGFTEMLDALAWRLQKRLQAGADREKTVRYLRALRLVETHRAAAQGNANPQTATAVLAAEMMALK